MKCKGPWSLSTNTNQNRKEKQKQKRSHQPEWAMENWKKIGIYILNAPGLNLHSELLVLVILVPERWPHSYIYLVQKVFGSSSNRESLVGKLAHQCSDIIIVTRVRWGRLSHLPDTVYLALPCQWTFWNKVELLKLIIIIIVVVM